MIPEAKPFPEAFFYAKDAGIQIKIAGLPAHVTTRMCNLQDLARLQLAPENEALSNHLVAIAFNEKGDIIGRQIINEALTDEEGLLTDDNHQMSYAAEVLNQLNFS